MVNNCLKTQLKSVVQNDNLRKLGVFKFQVKSVSNPTALMYYVSISTNSSCTISAPEGGFWLHNSADWGDDAKKVTSFTVNNASVDIYFESGDFDVEISNKYGITVFKASAYDTFVFDNVDALYSITDFRCPNSADSDFKLSELNNTLIVCIISNTGIQDDIKNASHLINVNALNVSGTRTIYGSIEEFASLMHTKYGRQNGTLSVNIAYSGVTYNGSTIESGKTIYFGTDMSGHTPTEAETAQGWCIR